MASLLDINSSQRRALDDLVSMYAEAEKTVARAQALRDGVLALASRFALSLAEESRDGIDASDLAARTVAAELGAAQRQSDRTVQRRMGDAEWSVTRFPEVWAAQGEGRISAAHTRVIVDAAEQLEDAGDRSAYSARVLEIAETQSPNRLRKIARRLAEKYVPVTLEERHQSAREERRVWVRDTEDGMAELGMLGPAVLVHGMFDRLTKMAKSVQGAGNPAEKTDERSLAQLRADLLSDLVLTGVPAACGDHNELLSRIEARVDVSVPVMTLMGAGDVSGAGPAELDGVVPIDTETARRLVGAASGWDRVLTHPISGAMLAVDRYRPSEQLKRHLRSRDQRCRFPTCGYRARDCDIDHTHAAAVGGETCDRNLAHFCRRHHVLKHHSPWKVKQIGAGVLEWTSPAGHVYVDEPPDLGVRFSAGSG